MSNVKTPEQVGLMRKSGEICAQALLQVLAAVRPGVTTLELDKIANREIKKRGGGISFQTVENYPYTICVSVNDEVVHGLPTKYALKEGDIIGIDIGVLYQGWHSDLAQTVVVGNVDKKTADFVQCGRIALDKAIAQARIGNKVGDISHAMQRVVEGQGYAVVRALTGHGVGRELHEEPVIPCFGTAGKGEALVEGMVIAIEVIYNMGKSDVVWKNDDGWTIAAADGSMSGLFERTVAITKDGPEVLTPID